MPAYNAITDTTLLSLKRYGATTLAAGAGETLTLDVGKQVIGVERKYQKIVDGALVEMTADEKTTVDSATSTDIILARTLTVKDSGAYKVSQIGSAYIITLPAVAKGLVFEFLLMAETAFNVTIRATSTHFYGAIDLAGTPTQVNASTDIIFDATDANIGDMIRMRGVDSTTWCVIGISTDASGISLA